MFYIMYKKDWKVFGVGTVFLFHSCKVPSTVESSSVVIQILTNDKERCMCEII